MKLTILHRLTGYSGSDRKSATDANEKPLRTSDDEPLAKPAIAWRELISFWTFGLCTEFGYVVMICAAYDILSRFDNVRLEHLFYGGRISRLFYSFFLFSFNSFRWINLL